MAMRKGKQVKSYKAYIPDAEGKNHDEIIKVYFSADTGLFAVYPPEHLMGFAASEHEGPRGGYSLHNDSLRSSEMKSVIEGYKNICSRYIHALKNRKKVRVISFTIARNKGGRYGEHKHEISFIDAPALHISYHLLWRVGDDLLTDHLSYAGKVKDAGRTSGNGRRHIIDWTQEREDFLKNMVAGMTELIERCDAFVENLEANVDQAITHKQGLFLPAPEKV